MGNAKVTVGGTMINRSTVRVHKNGILEVKKDLINEGNLLINDPEKIKQIVLEAFRTTKNLSDIGKIILMKLFK